MEGHLQSCVTKRSMAMIKLRRPYDEGAGWVGIGFRRWPPPPISGYDRFNEETHRKRLWPPPNFVDTTNYVIMKQVLAPEIKEVMESVRYRPAISIILPIQPKNDLKTEMSHLLKAATGKVERELVRDHPSGTVTQVMEKLQTLIKGLDMETDKKGIAIFVSPTYEKVLYLDMPVAARVEVGDSFVIRDLLYAKKEFVQYLVLLLSYKGCALYLGDPNNFEKIRANSIRSISEFMNDVPEMVANFSDQSERKEVMMDKYLHHIDNTLDHILQTYPFPLFIVGTERITGHFKKLSKHNWAVTGCVQGNYEEAGEEKLRELLVPQIAAWKKTKYRYLLSRLDAAYGENRLATGIKNTWREAMNNKGRLLVVEKIMYSLHYKEIKKN